jgi:hypothetical protein
MREGSIMVESCRDRAHNHFSRVTGGLPSSNKANRLVSVISFQPSTREFVEQASAGAAEPELSIEALRLRVRQQEILSDFGVLALKGTPFPELLDNATRPGGGGIEGRIRQSSEVLAERQ